MSAGLLLRSAFLALTLLHVAGLQLGWGATAWTGSVALGTLTLAAWLPRPVGDGGPERRRWPRHAVRLGLAALTAAALLLDARHGGRGWPTVLASGAGPGGWGPAEAALLAVAGGGTAAAAIGAVGIPRSWWRRLLPVAGGAAVAAAGLHLAVSESGGLHPGYVTAAVTPVLVAMVLLGVATGAVVAARRGATGVGLAVLACFLLVPLSGVLDDPRLSRPPVTEVVLYTQFVILYDVPAEAGLRFEYSGGAPGSTTIGGGVESVTQAPPAPGDFWTAELVWRRSVWLTVALVLALLAALPRFMAFGDDSEPTI